MILYSYIEGDLYEMVKSSKENLYISERPGDCWNINTYCDRCYFIYVSGELAGRLKIIEISVSDYSEALTGKFTQDQLTRKFGVY
jgi:hypothetical protein